MLRENSGINVIGVAAACMLANTVAIKDGFGNIQESIPSHKTYSALSHFNFGQIAFGLETSRLYKIQDASNALSIDDQQKLYGELLAALEGIRALENDWDGEGALQISASAYEEAAAIIENMSLSDPMPEIEPNTNGTISLYWEWIGGRAEIEIGQTIYSWAIFDSELGGPLVANVSAALPVFPVNFKETFMPNIKKCIHKIGSKSYRKAQKVFLGLAKTNW